MHNIIVSGYGKLMIEPPVLIGKSRKKEEHYQFRIDIGTICKNNRVPDGSCTA